MAKQAYEVVSDLYYPSPAVADGVRHAAPGEVVTDLPAQSVGWLLADGLIRPAQATAPATQEAGDADVSGGV